jgi:acyl carrier protein
MNKKVLEELKKIVLNTFSETKIEKPFLELEMGDIEEWDSQGNLNLLLAIEDQFNLRFSMEEMTEIMSISQILSKIERDLS